LKTILIGLSTALLTGLAIGVQATLTSRAGAIIGSVRTGLLTNLLGGSIAGIIILIMIFISGVGNWKIPSTALIMMSSAGLLGVMIITGVSFSLQRVGVTAGIAIIILGQMILSVIIDTKGIGGIEPITLSFSRVAGLLLLGVSIYLLLPKK
jgi:bacterial/archaeal transporter family-2 protein